MHLFMQLRRGKRKSKKVNKAKSVTVIINNKKTRQVGRARQGTAQGQGRKIILIIDIDKTLFLFVFSLSSMKEVGSLKKSDMIHAVADGKVLGRKCGLWTFYFVCDLKPPVLFCLLSMSVSFMSLI